MKKPKFLKNLALFGTALCAPVLLSGCTGNSESTVSFRVQNGYIQSTTDNTNWINVVSLEDLKGQDGSVVTIGGNGNWYINGVDTGVLARGTNGTNGTHGTNGVNGINGVNGEDGNGIKSITIDQANSDETKTTYVITFDDNTTFTYEVKNGTNGTNGQDGSVVTIGENGNWYIDGVDTGVLARGTNGTNGEDAEIDYYTITYSYGASSELFVEAKESDAIKATQWITTLPEVKSDFKKAFLGWFISETDKKIETYDFIGGDVTLEARFDRETLGLSGLYKNKMYVKTWNDISLDYPGAVKNNTIVSIGDTKSYFEDLSGELIIDNSITEIGNYAFYNCKNLTSVTLPNTLQSISPASFFSNEAGSLSSIGYEIMGEGYKYKNGTLIITSPITDINKCPSWYTANLNPLILNVEWSDIAKETSTAVPSYAFWGATNLKEIEIPEGVIDIGNYAFNACFALTSIRLPNTLNSLGTGCFKYCDNLKTVIYEKSGENYTYKNGTLTIADELTEVDSSYTNIIDLIFNVQWSEEAKNNASGELRWDFWGATNLRSIEIPEGITSIPDMAFYDCRKLTSITLPTTLQSIGANNFSNNSYSHITTVTYETSGEGYVFIDGTLTITSPLTDINIIPAWYNAGLNPLILNVEWAEGVKEETTVIPQNAFLGAMALNNIEIPESITGIGTNAFAACCSLSLIEYETSGVGYMLKNGTLTITNALTDINAIPAWYTDGLTPFITNVEWAEGVAEATTCIPAYAFFASTNLQNIIIPNGVISIGDYAFNACFGLKEIEIPTGVQTIGEYAFVGCRSLTNVVLPKGIKNLESFAFAYCENLISISIPETINTIGSLVFLDCDLLAYNQDKNDKNLQYLGNTDNPYLVFIGYKDKTLENICINSNCKIFERTALFGCYNLTSITIPAGVTSLGQLAFIDCDNLAMVTLKTGVNLDYEYDLPTPSKTGYTFKGWYTNAEGTGDPVTTLSTELYTQDTTYYAVFTEN